MFATACRNWRIDGTARDVGAHFTTILSGIPIDVAPQNIASIREWALTSDRPPVTRPQRIRRGLWNNGRETKGSSVGAH